MRIEVEWEKVAYWSTKAAISLPVRPCVTFIGYRDHIQVGIPYFENNYTAKKLKSLLSCIGL